MRIRDGEDEEEEEETQSKRGRKEKPREEEEEEEEEENEEEEVLEDAKPVGEAVRVSGKGRGRKSHYDSFEYDGNQYDLEDPVLLVPEEAEQKPYVAIIKDITQSKNGSMMVTGQWFYHPEEAEKKGGGNWQSQDTRELFYSFHRDDIPAESVMHKCVVHFVPNNKQLPSWKQHPGFIVQKVYDTVARKLWKLTDKDYEDVKQHEIDILVQKTLSRLGDLPDIETVEIVTDRDDQLKSKRTLRKRNISPLDVTRDDEATARLDNHMKAETPGSCPSNLSEYHTILSKSNALTGETHRDKWLERLLQGIQYMCSSPDQVKEEEVKEEVGNSDVTEAKENNANGDKSFQWPDAAVLAVTALEKVTHEAFSSDFQKYNQKLRQLVFNLKNTALLARRLLNGELEPSVILNMSPIELKEGSTAGEMASKEPEESELMQMTNAQCSRCEESKVGLKDIIAQAGHGDRYQLECLSCGNLWYASRDDASRLTIEGPGSKTVGTAPLAATTKVENVARDSEISVKDAIKKASEAYMPVLETQKSFGRSKNEEKSEPVKKEE